MLILFLFCYSFSSLSQFALLSISVCTLYEVDWLIGHMFTTDRRAGGEDDFDMFMECVKAKSHHAQARINSQGSFALLLRLCERCSSSVRFPLRSSVLAVQLIGF